MKTTILKHMVPIACIIILCSCGKNYEEGVFTIDCPIEGLQYETETETGETDNKGAFQFKEEEMIKFFLGDIQIGKTEAKEKLTPFDIAGGARSLENQAATNIFRLLISLDKDFPTSNGIQIDPEIFDDFSGRSLNFSYQDAVFEKMVNKLKPFDEGNYALCTVATAQSHMKKVLNEISEKPVQHKLHGLFFSPYIDNQAPNNDDIVKLQTIIDRMHIIKKYTNWIRSDGCTNGMENIGRVASYLDIHAALGARITDNLNNNMKEIESLIREVQANYADIAIVGSDALSQNHISINELIQYIQKVRASTQNIKITYADTYDVFQKYPQLINEIDLIFLNYHPFKEGILIDDAIEELQYRYNQLTLISSQKPIYISETGWPFDGASIGDAVANGENANQYLKEFVGWASRNQTKYFYFEAFDEKWRLTYDGLHGANMGLWNSRGLLKSGVQKFFETNIVESSKDLPQNRFSLKPTSESSSLGSQSTFTKSDHTNDLMSVKEHKTDPIVSKTPKTPAIFFTYVPPYGNRFHDLKGRVLNVNPNTYKVIVCCQINEKQVIMPNLRNMDLQIQEDGQWACDITGKQPYDWKASKITAFLVPENDQVFQASALFERDYIYCEIIREVSFQNSCQ
jgi:exo-beta-1,3-glucanase (GH17 family)